MRRAALVLLSLLALLALAGCGGDEDAAPGAAPADDGVEELANILQLRSDFEADAGKARVILLFSPT
jgi:ABC-type glycerol-3-phosphate transport system substrate-binding protein